jgi:hypothetical protein
MLRLTVVLVVVLVMVVVVVVMVSGAVVEMPNGAMAVEALVGSSRSRLGTLGGTFAILLGVKSDLLRKQPSSRRRSA